MRLRTLASCAAALTIVTLAGCKDWLVEEPQDFFPLNAFPQTEADLAIALGGIDNWYTGGSNQPYFIRGWPILTEVSSDQTITTQTSGSRYEMDSYTLTASTEWLWRVWQQIYGAIGASNFLIQYVPPMSQVSQDVKNRYLGAAKFHRAFNYFNAVRVWGGVPLVMRPDTSVAQAESTAHAPRAPMAEVYDSIVKDLQDAASLLPARWPGSTTPDDGRPTRWAAQAMLADVYMNMSGALVQADHWADAARAAKAVIDSGGYSLVPNFADLWLIKNKNGPEHIYSIQFQGVKRNLFTCQSRPSGVGTESCSNYWFTTEAFMNSFDSADARKPVTFLTQVTAGTVTYYYNRTASDGKGKPFGDYRSRGIGFEPYYGKFFDAGGPGMINQSNSRTDLNWPIYRYAEVLLTYAEAENEAVGPDASAYTQINAVRRRAQLPDLTLGLSQDQFRDSVRVERSHELAFESKRLFDLKRWGTFASVLSNDPVARTGVQPYHMLMPIPQYEMNLDPALAQNPGY
jgi:hypothetical protein